MHSTLLNSLTDKKEFEKSVRSNYRHVTHVTSYSWFDISGFNVSGFVIRGFDSLWTQKSQIMRENCCLLPYFGLRNAGFDIRGLLFIRKVTLNSEGNLYCKHWKRSTNQEAV